MISLLASIGIAVAILYFIIVGVMRRIEGNKAVQESIKDIPCEGRHWFYGTMRRFPPNQLGFSREVSMMKKFQRCYLRWYGPFLSIILGYHPDISRVLLSGNEPKNTLGYKFLRSWIGEGLLISHGKKWQRNRRLLTPIFHFDSLRRYLPCANVAVSSMVEKWKLELGESRSVEMFNDVSCMTLDNLLRCMFSYKTGCESGINKEYLNAVKYITEGMIQRIRNPFHHYDFIYYLTPAGRKYKEALNVLHRFTENAIQNRVKIIADKDTEPKKTSEYDFLDILLMSKDENGIGLTHQEIRDELDTFVFEGHDTVASAISWAFYNLAAHPDKQEICRKEVVKVLHDSNCVDWEHLPKFEYLTKFIKESLRLYPPVVEISRETSRSMSLPDVFAPKQGDSKASFHSRRRSFPKNSMLGLRIFLLHRNPTVWENPEIFDPERFDPENVGDRPPHAYVPFSAGPRNCIGQNFAMNEIKVVLAVALSNFKFTVDEAYPQPRIKNSVILRSEAGIHLIVERL